MHPSPHTNKHTNTHAHPHTISPVVITTHAPKHARTHARTHANTSRHSQHHHQHPHSPTHPQRTAPTPHTMVVRDHDLALLARRNSIRVTDRPTDSLPDRPTDRQDWVRSLDATLPRACFRSHTVGRSVCSVCPSSSSPLFFVPHSPTNEQTKFCQLQGKFCQNLPKNGHPDELMAILTNSWPS